MNVDTYLEAKEMYDKYTLCETVLKYLSDEDTPKGQKYLETLKEFVNAFPSEFMMFVHKRMNICGEMFESIHCPEHSEQPEESMPPSEPKEPKFEIGSKVEIIGNDYKGYVGTVKEFDGTNAYYVVSPEFSMWFYESDLESYTEESENPEEPEPEVPSEPKFNIGDKVVITVPEYNGATATVADYNEADGYLLVDIEGYPEETYGIWFPEEVLAPYVAPENPEDNG